MIRKLFWFSLALVAIAYVVIVHSWWVEGNNRNTESLENENSSTLFQR